MGLGRFAIRCPHCGEPPGNELLALFGRGWTCAACGEAFDSPSLIPIKQLEKDDD